MKKLLILLALTMATTACSMDNNPMTSNNTEHICIDGVTYITLVTTPTCCDQGLGIMSGKLDKDGNAIPCGVEVE